MGPLFWGLRSVKLPLIWRKPLGAFIIPLWTDREILRTTFRDGPPSPFSSAYSSQISSISEICNSLLKLSSAYQMPILGPGKGSCAVENDGRACSRSIAFKLYSTPTVRATLCIWDRHHQTCGWEDHHQSVAIEGVLNIENFIGGFSGHKHEHRVALIAVPQGCCTTSSARKMRHYLLR